MNFSDRIAACAAKVAACLDGSILDRAGPHMAAPMRHATQGGKGIRGFLVMESAALHEVDADIAIWAASAVEAAPPSAVAFRNLRRSIRYMSSQFRPGP